MRFGLGGVEVNHINLTPERTITGSLRPFHVLDSLYNGSLEGERGDLYFTLAFFV